MSYVITTDTLSDLPESYFAEHGIMRLSLKYLLDGQTYDLSNSLSGEEFYARMRAGSTPTTSQFNPDDVVAGFEPILREQKDILHISFSSGLSGSYNSARLGAEELREKYPERKIVVVDSLCASMGQGLLLYKAVQLKESGMEMDELTQWLENNKMNVVHLFTVEDLIYLHRGGRLSKLSAVLGTTLNLKPVLHVDDEGHLVAFVKVRGRKKALTTLVDSMEKKMGSWHDKNDIVMISHGDCLEEAQYVADQIKAHFGIESFLLNPIGPVIGSHAGPGTIALFFMGDER